LRILLIGKYEATTPNTLIIANTQKAVPIVGNISNGYALKCHTF
jgi:hypothetical protein